MNKKSANPIRFLKPFFASKDIVFMKSLSIILLCLLSSIAYGQKTKLYTVVEIANPFVKVEGFIQYNGNIPSDTTYYLRGMDQKYQSLHEYIILGVSEKVDVLKDFLNVCLKVVDSEDVGTTIEESSIKLQVTGVDSYKRLAIFGRGNDSDRYVLMTKAQIKRLLGKFH